MSYIGQRPVVGRYIKLDQISSGFNGSNTGFSMTAGSQAVFPGTARNLLLSLGGVIQEPDTDFTISGSTLTFTTPPVANTTFFGVIYGDMQATGTPSDGTVLPASIASSGNFSFPQLTVTSSASLLGGAVFNENGADVDFRVEGDTEANLLFVDASTDRVGIGTSSPTSLLTLNHATAPFIRLNDSNTTKVGIGADGGLSYIFAQDGNPLVFTTSSGTAFTERMRIDSQGRLLLGTTTEGQASADDLTIATTGNTGITVRSGTSNAGNIYFSDATSGTAEYAGYLSYSHSTNSLSFGTNDGSERMRIDSSGNVGINDTSPSKTLDITGVGGGNGEINVKRTSGATCMIQAQAAVAVFGSSSNHRVDFKSNGALAMTINTSQKVGIGTTSPDASLHELITTSKTNSIEHMLILEHLSSGTTTTGFGAGIRFRGERNNGVMQNIGDINLEADVNSGSNISCAMVFKPGVAGVVTERMRITSAGNVGIGTASPAEKLDIDGNIKLPDNGTVHFGVSDTAFVRGKDSTDGYVLIGTNGVTAARFDTAKTLRMNECPSLDATAGSINITGGGSGGRIAIQGTSTSAGAGLAEMFAFWGTNKVAGMIALSGSDTTNKDDGHLTFMTSSAGPAVTERMRIKSDGKVGIGTAGPEAKLQVAGSIHVTGQDSVANTSLQLSFASSEGHIKVKNTNASTAANLAFHTTDTSGNTNRVMSITHSGRIGINETDPQSQLVIKAPTDDNPGLALHRNSGGGDIASIDWTSGSGTPATQGRINYRGGSGGNEGMAFYVNAGMSSPAIWASLSKRIRLPGVPGVAGSNLANVSIESDGNLCTTTSIRAAKKNIAAMTDTSWLFDLNPVTFNWRTKTQDEDGNIIWGEDTDGGTQYGLIAEEVKEVKDDFCYYDNDGNLTGVHYDRLVAPLLKAIQDLKAENTALTTRVAALEAA